MATHPITGRTLATGSSAPAGWTQDNSLEDWLADNGNLVGVYADAAARTAAYTASGKTLGSADRAVTVLKTGTVEVWDGTAWKVLSRLASIDAEPLQYISTTIGPVAGLNNTSLAGLPGSAYSFVPTRSGLARATAYLDIQGGTAGYGGAFAKARMTAPSAVDIYSERLILAEPGDRQPRELRSVPFRVTSGTTTTIQLDVRQFGASGNWQVNSAQWVVTVE